MRTKMCRVCGESFQLEQAASKYCSEQCRIIGRDIDYPPKGKSTLKSIEPLLFQRDCAVCGIAFLTPHRGRKFCSELCATERKKEQIIKSHIRHGRLEPEPWTTERICSNPECRRPFLKTYANQTYCCSGCRRAISIKARTQAFADRMINDLEYKERILEERRIKAQTRRLEDEQWAIKERERDNRRLAINPIRAEKVREASRKDARRKAAILKAVKELGLITEGDLE